MMEKLQLEGTPGGFAHSDAEEIPLIPGQFRDVYLMSGTTQRSVNTTMAPRLTITKRTR